MSKDVFIAYSRKDVAAAEAVEKALQQSGLECFRDVTSTPGSARWLAEIGQAIRYCHTMVVLLSEDSVQSSYVPREVHVAVSQEKSLVPVLLSRGVHLSDEMSLLVAPHQHILAWPSVEEALSAIVEGTWLSVDRSRHRNAYKEIHELMEEVTRLGTCNRDIDFAEDRCGLYVGDSQCGSTRIEAGAYVMEAMPREYLGYELEAVPAFADGLWEVRIRKLGGPDDQWFGLELGERYPGNYYQFLLNGQGAIRVARHLHGEWRDLGCNLNLRQARCGNDQNTLRVARRGPAAHVFLNGLHALSVSDNAIPSGRLGLVIGWGIRATFSGLHVEGIDLATLYAKAMEHWSRLEMIEARALLRRISDSDPDYRHPSTDATLWQFLWAPRPDHRRSVLIVVGGGIVPQLYDGAVAARLRDEINSRGQRDACEFAAVVTETALQAEHTFLQCPIIAVGGPISNKTTEAFLRTLPEDSLSSSRVKINHDIPHGDRRVALWGKVSEEGEKAVELFVSSGLLDRYLEILWSRPVQSRPAAAATYSSP